MNITETEKNSSDYYYGSSHQEILLPAILSGVLLLIFICVSLFIRLRKKYFHNNSSSPSRRTKHDSNSSWCSNCCIGTYQLRIFILSSLKVSKCRKQNTKFSHPPKKQRNFVHFFSLSSL